MKPPTEETLAMVNELLRGATPMSAYAMGLATTSAAQANIDPPRQLLLAARGCTSVEEAIESIESWITLYAHLGGKAGA